MSEQLVVIVNQQGPIAEVWINRPRKKNALTLEMLDMLVSAGRALAAEPALRAVVLSGAGGDFSAGVDTGVLMAMAGQLDALRAEMMSPPEGEVANRFQLPATIWAQVPVPVIAAINGNCLGGGAQIALGADFRVISPGATFALMEGKWGLIPDMGLSQSLPRLLAADRAKELVMSGRFLRGDEAYSLGLATFVANDPLLAARRLAAELAERSPEAIRSAKTLIDTMYAGKPEEHLPMEANLQADLMGSPNQIETIMANMQKRAPNYR